MNTIVKLLAPAVLSLAALSANAGVTEIDYPSDVIQSRVSMTAETGAASVAVGSALNLTHSESAVRDVPAADFVAPTREEVRGAIPQTNSDDVGYFA